MRLISGVISAEFFALFMILLSIFIFFFIAASSIQTISAGMAARERATSVASTIAAAANMVLLAGNSTNTTVTVLPGYNISYSPKSITAVDNESRGGSAALLTDRVNLSVAQGAQVIAVWNSNGEVFVRG